MNRKEVEEVAYKIRELTKRSDLFAPEVIKTLSEAYYIIVELDEANANNSQFRKTDGE
jgi:hypothetical protein